MNRAPRIAVWDIPTRLFHWVLVGLLAFSWWSAENGRLDWHLTSGLSILALLVFRLIWGVIGSSTARFVGFLRGPRSIAAYLRGKTPPVAGHNPLGGWSVVAMLAVLSVQVGSGLLAVDVDGIESGPLSYLVEFDQGRTAASIHDISFNVLLALIVLHVLTILFYLVVRRRNLVGPMITGRDHALDPAAAPLRRGKLWAFLLSLVVAVAAAWWVASGAPV
ncbi:cytochrome b/b6 domain-containing protein [Novosphingobium sp. RD2P27]|uniref:Cytochrome b/b6 domain-containing protein n=1 Tax=Novosphingobium kalidii TaxID=3230299 RepID=A0ABV2D1W1_9SPHN